MYFGDMQVNVRTHTTTVIPELKHHEFIKELKQLHKVQDDKELFGMVVKTQPKDVTTVKLNELKEKRRCLVNFLVSISEVY